VYEERKNQRAPPQIKKENTKPVVEIVPYDDGWPEYDEPVFDLNKFKYCKGISVFELRVIGRKR
jgi:hypothetical protein